jgi:hypothetical protein
MTTSRSIADAILVIATVVVIAAVALLVISIISLNVYAGDTNCNAEPESDVCTGEAGADGMYFCGTDRFDDCYDGDFSRIDCSGEHNETSRCTGYSGREGLMFCDLQFDDVGYRDNCYNRDDNPTEYCDKYAKDESDRPYTNFCQTVCANYEDVIIKDKECLSRLELDEGPES